VVRDKKLIGLVTHRDLLQVSASSLSSEREVRDKLIREVPASRIMCSEIATVGPDESIVRAGELMWDMKVGCLCVTDDDDNLVGIVTEPDFVRLAVQLGKRLGAAPPKPPPPRTAP